MVLLSRNPVNYNPFVEEINASGGHAIGISADVSDAASVNSAFDQIAKQFPGAPLAAAIFNAAGGFTKKPFLELTEAEFSGGIEGQAYVF